MKMKAMASSTEAQRWQWQRAGGGKSAAEAGSTAARRRLYTAFFEQSIPVWNRLSYPTYVGIQGWKKLYSLGISIFYIHT
jgi:hypothetical protein